MKKVILATAVALLSMSAQSADLQGFVTPETLGMTIKEASEKYGLDIQPFVGGNMGKNDLAYQIDGSKYNAQECQVYVHTNKNNHIKSIMVDGMDCAFKADNPLNIELGETTVNEIIAQITKKGYNAYPTNYYITPIFDCPKCVSVEDVFTVSNVKDDYEVKFEILGDIPEFQKEVATKYLKLKKYNPNQHYQYMKKIEKLFKNRPSELQKDDFKNIAFKYYGGNEVQSYTIALK